MQQRKAVVIGATGLVGRELVNQLLGDERFSELTILVRRSSGLQHPKLREHLINFDEPAQWNNWVRGDVLFSTLGTTLKQAGSKQAQYRVDHTYQFQAAKAAAKNGVPVYVLVSAYMASERSRIFYSRMKGELERDVKQLGFPHLFILQPGMLAGERKEHRAGESAGLGLIRFLNKLGIAKKHRPVHASIVAKAMINASFRTEKERVFALEEVFHLAEGS